MSARRLFLHAFLAVLLIGPTPALQSQSVDPSPRLGSPPVAPVRPVTDDYYGTKVVDPYRYMENLKDPEVQAWMKAQNDYTRAVLASIPGREKLLERIRQLDQSVPLVLAQRLPGGLYIIRKPAPSGNVFNFYVRHGLRGEDRLWRALHPA